MKALTGSIGRHSAAPALGFLSVLAAGTLLGACGTNQSSAGPSEPDATVTVTATVTATPSAEEDSYRPEAKPKPSDFRIKLRIRQKECFGSAGCNITYQIDPQYVGDVDLGTGSYDVTYKVIGAEDGPQINTFKIKNGRASYDAEEMVSTPSSSTRLKAKVTHVYRG